jgi:hypothetical protein
VTRYLSNLSNRLLLLNFVLETDPSPRQARDNPSKTERNSAVFQISLRRLWSLKELRRWRGVDCAAGGRAGAPTPAPEQRRRYGGLCAAGAAAGRAELRAGGRYLGE